MFNYLKWELKDYLNGQTKWFIAIAIIFALVLISGLDVLLISLAFLIIMLLSLFETYFAGTKHAVDTFSKKTFLLESMIPVSGKKILLAKYILGIIINTIYGFIVFLGIIVISIKGIGIENTLEGLKEIINYQNPVELLQTLLTIICSSTLFLSIVVLCFVGAKALNPGNKYDKIVGFVFAYIALYFTSTFLNNAFGKDVNIMLVNLVFLCITSVAFFITSYLVENKLEIYS